MAAKDRRRRLRRRRRVVKLRAALVRLLWASVADDAECTCVGMDPCPLCQASSALALGRWRSAHEMALLLLDVKP